jgi:hypothetical protein
VKKKKEYKEKGIDREGRERGKGGGDRAFVDRKKAQ